MTKESEKQNDERIKLLNFIGEKMSDLADFIEKNKVDPGIVYEVMHEMELAAIEECKRKGFDALDLELHKQVAEMNFKADKNEMKSKGIISD